MIQKPSSQNHIGMQAFLRKESQPQQTCKIYYYRQTYQYKKSKEILRQPIIQRENFCIQTIGTIYLKGINKTSVNNNSKDFKVSFSCPDILMLLQPRHYRV